MRAVVEQFDMSTDSSFRAYFREDSRFDFNWHCHAQYELTLILHSHGQRFVGDHIENYSDGDLVLLGPNLPHTWSAEPWTETESHCGDLHTAVVAQFNVDFLGQEFFSRPELAHVGRMLDRARDGIAFTGSSRDRAHLLLQELATLDATDQLLRLLETLHILAKSDRYQTLSNPGYVLDRRFQVDHRQIETICTYVGQHFSEPIRQAEIACMFEMSASQFSQFFKRSTGRTFIDYVNAIRVAHASRQLIETDRSVIDICFSCGFFNVSNFNRRFRRVQGMSPREFRQAHRLQSARPKHPS